VRTIFGSRAVLARCNRQANKIGRQWDVHSYQNNGDLHSLASVAGSSVGYRPSRPPPPSPSRPTTRRASAALARHRKHSALETEPRTHLPSFVYPPSRSFSLLPPRSLGQVPSYRAARVARGDIPPSRLDKRETRTGRRTVARPRTLRGAQPRRTLSPSPRGGSRARKPGPGRVGCTGPARKATAGVRPAAALPAGLALLPPTSPSLSPCPPV
jgi:hypothetical protein